MDQKNYNLIALIKMTKFLTVLRHFLFAFLILWIVASIALKCYATTVDYLPQYHKTKETSQKINKDKYEQVVQSQFKILRFLLEYPDASVFVEGLTSDYFTPAASSGHILAFQRAFQKGVPNSYELLSNNQKDALYVGAHNVALALGLNKAFRATANANLEINNGFRVMDLIGDRSDDQFIQAIGLMENPELTYRVTRLREKWVVEEILKYTESRDYAGEKIILIYGAAHNFEQYNSDQIKFTIPDGFSAWSPSEINKCRISLLPAPKS